MGLYIYWIPETGIPEIFWDTSIGNKCSNGAEYSSVTYVAMMQWQQCDVSDHKYLQTTSAPLDIIEGLSKVERQLLKDKVASKATKQSKILLSSYFLVLF